MAWVRKLIKNEDGSMAVMGALASGLLIIGSAAALDISRLHSMQQSLQEAADAAALVGAIEYNQSSGNINNVVAKSVAGQPISGESGVTVSTPVIGNDTTTEAVTVQLDASVSMYMGAVFGQSHRPIRAVSTASYGGESFDPMTIMFVLDASGSMNARMEGKRRIHVLEDTVKGLFAETEERYGNDQAVQESLRTGMNAYAWYIHTESTQPIAPGWSQIIDNVDDLRLSNGTIPALAVEEALEFLLADRTGAGADHKQFMVFMTDGEVDDHLTVRGDTDNTGRSFTQRTLDTCQQAKDNGIIVLGVGMNAPVSSQDLLLKCASPDVSLESYSSEAQSLDQKCANLNSGTNRQDCVAGKLKYFSNNGHIDDFEVALSQAFPQSQPVAIRITH